MKRIAIAILMAAAHSTAARANPAADAASLENLNLEAGFTHVEKNGYNLFGETELSVTPRLTRHSALRVGIDVATIGVEFDGAGGTTGATLGLPTYVHRAFHGPYVEPSVSYFSGIVGGGLHAGWTFRAKRIRTNLSMAVGVERSGFDPQFAMSGQLRAGHAF